MFSQGKLQRGKRQFGPYESTDDDMTEEEAKDNFYETLARETEGKPSMYELLQEKNAKFRKEKEMRYLESIGYKVPITLLERAKSLKDDSVQRFPKDFRIVDSETGEIKQEKDETPEVTPTISAKQQEFLQNQIEKLNQMTDDDSDVDESENDNKLHDEFTLDGMDLENDPDIDEFMKSIGDEDKFDMDQLLKSMGGLGDSTGSDGDMDIPDDVFDSEGNIDKAAAKKRYGFADLEDNNNENEIEQVLSDRIEKLSKLKQSQVPVSDNNLSIPSNLLNLKEEQPLSRKTNLSKAPYSNPLLCLLDNEQSSPSVESENDVIPLEEIDRQWNQVYFGRCPNPDYSEKLLVRRENGRVRADALYNDMISHGVAPDEETLSLYMSVSSEGCLVQSAYDVLEKMKSKHNLPITTLTYRYLARMHIFTNDYDSALVRIEEMKNLNMIPDSDTYGIVIQSLSHRDKLVEALKLLEDASEHGVVIDEENLKKLRVRCEKFGIKHPNMPADPNQWVKDVKDVRRRYRNRSQRAIESIRSLKYV
jgi:pentatricopeptide repeat protein